MSARPRPVTATVNHSYTVQDLPENRIYRRRSLSISSGSSTASLVSVLDHDSYESLSDHESEVDGHNVESIQNRLSDTEITESESCVQKESQLSPWEQWLIRKVKEDRDKLIKRKKEEELERQKKEQEETEKKEKCKKAEEKTKEWIEKKSIEEQKIKSRNERKAEFVKRKKEEEKKQIQEKAEKEYQQWMEKKKQREKELKEKEREKKRLEEEQKLERQRKNEEAFEEWKRRTKDRPKSAPVSYGIISGKLSGYYNSSAYPSPSYCNPIPWKPIPVPSQKTERKKRPKAKMKYCWNPQKYL